MADIEFGHVIRWTNVWRPTMELRFQRRVSQTAPNAGSVVTMLQQAWQDVYGGEVEWRDVPLVEATNER
jgi:hypothetical protein